jgi:hypothetical protein
VLLLERIYISSIQQRMVALPEPPYERFMHTLFMMLDKGYIQMGAADAHGNAKFAVTKLESSYFINWDNAAKALGTHKFFVPDIERLDASFTEHKEQGISDDPKGWMIDANLWHLTYSRWKSIYA